MKNSARGCIAITALVATFSALPANALERSLHEFGQRGDMSSLQRTIRITPETASVSVYRMETVRFVDGRTGQSFVWRFDTPRGENFPLAAIAPPGFLDGQAVTAYVWDLPVPGTMLILYLLGGRASFG